DKNDVVVAKGGQAMIYLQYKSSNRFSTDSACLTANASLDGAVLCVGAAGTPITRLKTAPFRFGGSSAITTGIVLARNKGQNGQMEVFLRPSDPTTITITTFLTPTAVILTPAPVIDFALGDLNADGNTDIVAALATGAT